MSGNGEVEALFRSVHPRLVRYLEHLAGDSEQARDIAQEAFARYVAHAPTVADPRKWLFTVATNLLRDGARTAASRARLRPPPELLLADPPVPPDQAAERSQEVARARAALAVLPERDRIALLMHHEGFRYDEIAALAQVAPTSVGTLLARATRRFVQELRSRGGVDAAS